MGTDGDFTSKSSSDCSRRSRTIGKCGIGTTSPRHAGYNRRDHERDWRRERWLRRVRGLCVSWAFTACRDFGLAEGHWLSFLDQDVRSDVGDTVDARYLVQNEKLIHARQISAGLPKCQGLFGKPRYIGSVECCSPVRGFDQRSHGNLIHHGWAIAALARTRCAARSTAPRRQIGTSKMRGRAFDRQTVTAAAHEAASWLSAAATQDV